MAVRWHKPLQIAVAGLSSLDSELVLAKTSKSTVSEPMVCGKLSYLCRMFANMLAWYVNFGLVSTIPVRKIPDRNIYP
jgi:hypothetical protein